MISVFRTLRLEEQDADNITGSVGKYERHTSEKLAGFLKESRAGPVPEEEVMIFYSDKIS